MINTIINQKLGDHFSADIILHSLNFEKSYRFMQNNQWDLLSQELIHSASLLSQAKADYFIICCNSAHKVYQTVTNHIDIACIHIMEPIINVIKQENFTKVGLIGTNFTMSESFHKDYVRERLNIELITPEISMRNEIHHIIINQLCYINGAKFNEALQQHFNQFIKQNQLDAVILACTELAYGVNQSFSDAKLLDTTRLHATKAAEISIQNE